MARLILFSEYTKNIEHAVNNLEYISTREGIVTDEFSATPNQKNYIDAFSKELGKKELEQLSSFLLYENTPTKENASKLLNDLENMFESKLHATNYLEYSATRKGSHGLFNESGTIDHKEAEKQMRKEAKTTYMHVVALEHDNAVATGFDKLESWQNAIKTAMPEFASKMKIDLDDLVWYAAFHDHKNPHVHITMYSKSNKAWLNKKDFESLRKMLGQQIYAQEMKDYSKEFKQKQNELVTSLKDLSNFSNDSKFNELLKETYDQLKTHTGRSYYQYLEQGLKDQVAQIIEYLVTNDQQNYKLFCETIEASKKYTDIYSNNNSFVEDFLYPGQNHKKQVHNFIIDYLKNQYKDIEHEKDIISTTTLSVDEVTFEDEIEPNSIEIDELSKVHEIKELESSLVKSVLDSNKFIGDSAYFKLLLKANESVLKQSKLSSYNFASKSIKHDVSKLLSYVINNDDHTKKILKEYASLKDETVNNVTRELLYPTRSDNQLIHNNLLKNLTQDFSTDIMKHQDMLNYRKSMIKGLMHDMEEKLASEILTNANDILSDHKKMHQWLNNQYYKNLDVSEQLIINNFVEKTVTSNETFKSLFDGYINQVCKSNFDRSYDKHDPVSYFTENKPILERKFFDGQLNTSLHDYVLEALKTMNKDISSNEIADLDNLKDWTDEVEPSGIKISEQLNYHKTVKLLKTIAKAYALSEMKKCEIIKKVEELIKVNNLDLVHNKDELLNDVFSSLAKDKTLSDLSNQPLRLTRKDIEVLNNTTESEIEYEQVYTQPNSMNTQDYALGFGSALLKLGKGLEKSDPVNKNKAPTQSKQKNKKKNQSMYLDI